MKGGWFRGWRGALLALAALGLAPQPGGGAEPPRADRPTYALGEEWFRNDGVYELVRIEDDRYVFAAGQHLEIHLTRDLAIAKMRRGANVVEFDPPPSFTWPLEVGRSGSSRGIWRSPQHPEGRPAMFAWSVEASEQLQVPAGTFGALRIRLAVSWFLGPRKGQREVSFRLWYAPEARQLVKAAGEQRPSLLDFELAHLDRSGDRAGPPPGTKRYGLEFLDALEAVQRGEGREALGYYEWLVARRERTGPPLELVKAHSAVAWVAGRSGQHQKTIRSALRALDLLRALPASEDTLGRRLNLYSHVASSYRAARDLQAARRYSEEGLALARTSTRHQRAVFFSGVFLSGLVWLATAQGDPGGAVRHGEEAVRFFDQFLSQLPQAPRFERIRNNGRRTLALTLGRLANAHRSLGNSAEAEAAGRRGVTVARDAGHPEAEVTALLPLGWLALAAGDAAAGLAHFREAEGVASRAGLTGHLMWPLSGMGAAHARQGQHAEALAAYRRAVAAVEDVRSHLQEVGLRSGFLEDKQTIYYGAARSALALGDPAEAFGFAERARARAFLDLLGGQTVLSKGRTRALVAEETNLRAELARAQALAEDAGDEETAVDQAQARPRLEAAERAYRAFLERVRREDLEQASLMTVEPVTLQEVQRLLPEGVSMMEYLVTPSETVLWIVDARRVEVVRLPVARRDLVASVRALRQAVAAQAPLPEVQARGRALYDLLFAPARPHLKGDRLLVVPHDVLHYLPFAALRSPEGRWLVEEHTLSTLPSASVLKYLQGKGQGAHAGALAVGNPDVGPALALRYAEREARLVGQRVPGATVLVRGEATEGRAKPLSEQSGLLHFATHGELNEEDPLSSALLLVPEGREDGRLEVREIFGLDLKARLVVLSACETGLGQLSRGDELVGLQRAFLYAGTPAVVTTLWKVDDRASYRLMEAFYAHRDARGPATALRDAQRATMAEFPHPFAWAAFGVTGVPE